MTERIRFHLDENMTNAIKVLFTILASFILLTLDRLLRPHLVPNGLKYY